MSLYLAFDEIVHQFNQQPIRFAVAGGLAVGLHGHVRATEDIDLLVAPEDLAAADLVLRGLGYRANPEPQQVAQHALAIHRFFKSSPGAEDLLVVDLLVPQSAALCEILKQAGSVTYREMTLRVIQARDLIAMKRLRDSKTDQADIEYLEKNR